MPRARALLYAALCLCVPLPAFALSAESETQAPANLSVKATLDECGLAETQIVCGIDVAFDPLADATRYTASIARPDGSVVDHGAVDAGSATVWVPYAGNGTYLVEVSAYGALPGEPSGRDELLGREEAEAEAGRKGEGKGEARKPDAPRGEAKDGEGDGDGEGPACPPAAVDSPEGEGIAALEQQAAELRDQAAESEDEDETSALEDQIGALEDQIGALEDQIRACADHMPSD